MHRQFYERRAEWFEVMGERHLVFWWVPEGHRPTLEEALARLAHLRAHGESEHAFGWACAEGGAAVAGAELRRGGGGVGDGKRRRKCTAGVERRGFGLIPVLILLVLVVVPYWKIWQRTGHSGAWGLLMLVRSSISSRSGCWRSSDGRRCGGRRT